MRQNKSLSPSAQAIDEAVLRRTDQSGVTELCPEWEVVQNGQLAVFVEIDEFHRRTELNV